MRVIITVLIWACVIAWAGLAIEGVLTYLSLEPTGSSFTRGSNRIKAFLGWEAYALAAALAAFIFGRMGQSSGVTRLASRAPLWISGEFFLLLTLGFVGLLVWARLF
ncbi:MAG: hypothetical protein GXP04_07485 [Alphaproteobacteria bacterium]|nr:hypothetical protein [Alphaproteobacteria bacterium]